MPEIKGRGRPVKFTNDEIEQALRESQGVLSLAADKLSKIQPGRTVTRQCLFLRIKNSTYLSDVLDDVRQRVIDFAEVKLIEAVRAGDLKAIMFFLKTQAKERGYIEREEVTGAGGKDLHPVAMPDIEVNFLTPAESTK